MLGRHASTGPLPWPLLAGNSGNFTRQSKIDGSLDAAGLRHLAGLFGLGDRPRRQPGALCHMAKPASPPLVMVLPPVLVLPRSRAARRSCPWPGTAQG